MNAEDYQRLAMVVNTPGWDTFLEYIEKKATGCHERLELCPLENLKGIQGELKIIRDILTLRKIVNNIMSER